jgi:hypothetical protein
VGFIVSGIAETQRSHGPRRAVGIAMAAVAAIATSLICMASPALAVYSHNDPSPTTFPTNPNCKKIEDIAILEPEGLIYVACQTAIGFGEFAPPVIQRFHLDGSPAPFSATEPYLSGNEITADPSQEYGQLGSNAGHLDIAVDSSSSVNHGRLFITSIPSIDVFEPSGELAFTILQRTETCCVPNNNEGVDVGPEGSIYITSPSPEGRVSKYDPQLQEVKRLYTFTENTNEFGTTEPHAPIRVDSTGAVWFRKFDLRKYEANQFTTELTPRYGVPAEPRYEAKLSPYVTPNPLLQPKSAVGEPVPSELGGIDVDTTTNELYVDRENRIEVFSPGTAAEPSYRTIPAFGSGKLHESFSVAVTKDHNVYASTEGNKIVHFGPGDILPNVHTFTPQLNDIGHHEVTLHGKVELAGGSNVKDCKFEYGTTTAYSGGTVQCIPDAAVSPPGSYFSSDQEVSATISGLTTGQQYHFRLAAENEKGKNPGVDRVVTPAFVLKTQTLAPSGIDDHGASLAGSFDPDGLATEYKFEYGLTTSYGLETQFASGGNGSGVVTKDSTVSSLPSGKVFHYRVVARNGQGTTFGEDMTFRTASAPDVYSARATSVTATTATLDAAIDPVGYETKYRFDYGPTNEYGQSVPVSLASIGSGSEPVAVSQEISNLQPGVTYHFRVVAENEWGESTSDDTTFDFSPPSSCPNSHIRQQTGASYLPDCRAYELVTPGSAGAAILLPSNVVAEEIGSNNAYYGEGLPTVLNRGFARSPSRFSYWTAISSLPETDSPVWTKDMNVATRTSTGWVTRVPGLHNIEALATGRKLCSESLSLCADHSETNEDGYVTEGAPYIFDSEGKYRGRLPTNLKAIEATTPNAARFVGGQVVSGDFKHYVFSSSEYSFAPGGVLGGIGSAYDNNIGERAVTVVSKMPNGEDIPLQVSPLGTRQKKIDFRSISPDGSHILMETPGAPSQVEDTPNAIGKPLLHYLYMRVNDGVTYDIGRGHPVEPIGMTRNGEKVFFVTTAQMPGTGDTDSSADLYMWEEKGDKLTLLSQGNGNGNSDNCNATWVTGCGVTPLTPERAHPKGNMLTSVPGEDDLFAEESGDIYFYSPELLDPLRPGIKNQKNLYLYRNGVVQLVATLEAGTEISRVQISPNGAHAAFLTGSRLSPFDTKGFKEVYTYNADTGVIRCASCNPNGSPPTGNAAVSQGGRFMSNDGRTFFATPDALVSRDQNGSLIDVYEYVDGRPQLISSGLGNSDFTGSEVINLFLPGTHTGLEAVSRDGTDVYFTTFDTLVAGDLNGEYVKVYDARSGGGFPQDPGPAPCAAADECHGSDSSAPTAPTIATESNLGTGGNVDTAGKKQATKAKHRRHKKHRRSHSRHARHGNG